MTLPATGSVIPTVATGDGTVYTFSTANEYSDGDQDGKLIAVASGIEDRNGNQIGISLANNSSTAFTITDTLKRPAIVSSGFGASGDTITISGLENPYVITWGTQSFSFSANFNPAVQPPAEIYCAPNQTASGSNNVIKSIELPNGQSYTFTYDSTYGTLSQINYPTGGWVHYTWGINPQSAVTLFPNVPEFRAPDGYGTGPIYVPAANVCAYKYDKPVIIERDVSFDGSNVALKQVFHYSAPQWDSSYPYLWDSLQTTVTTTTSSGSFNTTYNYVPDTSLVPDNDSILDLTDGQRPLEAV